MEERKKRKSVTNLLVKECVLSALLQLIYKKTLSSITISELCQRAGVSRMAFYRNYESKEDIFKKHLQEIFAEYREEEESEPQEGIYYDRAHMIHYFTYHYKYREFMAGLVRCGFGTMFLEMLNEYILKKWKKSADTYTLIAFSGAIYNLFNQWAAEGYAEKKEKLAERVERMFQK